MGFQQALSGLRSSETALNVISNNVANATTVGFKSQNAYFSDVYAGAIGDNALGRNTIGGGSYVSDVATNYTQGSPTNTGGELDMAINGAGFFVLEDNQGRTYYSRNGQFYLDKEGYIRNATARDAKLMGFAVDDAGNTTGGTPTYLYVDKHTIEPVATTQGFLVGNFDSRSEAPYVDFTLPTATNVPDPQSYNRAISQTVYDSLGNAHSLDYHFVKTSTNHWTAFLSVDQGVNPHVEWALGSPPVDSNYLNLAQFQQGTTNTVKDLMAKYPEVAALIRKHFPQPAGSAAGAGEAAFDAEFATLTSTPPYDELLIDYPTFTNFAGMAADADFQGMTDYLRLLDNPADPNHQASFDEVMALRSSAFDIVFDNNGQMIQPANPSKIPLTITGLETVSGAWGNALDPTNGVLEMSLDLSNSTQFGQSWGFSKSYTNGNTSGDFAGILVTENGFVQAKYTNGATRNLGVVALATFPSTHGLARMGDNLYAATFQSGQAVLNAAGEGLNGIVLANSIEESNVDLTNELVQMIIQQRSYQANSQSIKTQDTILQTVINLR